MTPHPYTTLTDADLWEHYRERGLSAADATKHVELRRHARDGAAAAELERSQSQDVGPMGTAAQAILENSPAAGANMMGASGELAGRVAQAVPGLGAVIPGLGLAGVGGKFAGKVLPNDLLQRGEAALAGMPYEQFQATNKASKEANPVSAMTGPLGWLIAPGVGVGGMVKKRLAQKATKRAEDLVAVQLTNELKKKALARVEQQTAAPEADAVLRASLQKAGVAPEYMDAAVESAKKGMAGKPYGLGMEGPPTPPEPMPTPGVPAPGPGVMPFGPREPIPPDPLEVAPRLRTTVADAVAGAKKIKAKSYKELRSLLRKGTAPEDIEVGYYTRGGKLEQSVPPLPSVTPKNPMLRYSLEDLQGMLFRHPPEVQQAARAELIRRLGLQ